VTDHSRDAQATARLRAKLVEIAAVEIGIGQYRLARHFVERDVLGGEIGRCRDHESVANTRWKTRRPCERLHAAQAAAHDRSPLLDAETIGESRLCVDPILDGHEREIRTVRLTCRRIDRLRAGRSEATAEIVDADDEEAVGIERLARTDHVVPPTDVCRIVGVVARDVMRRVQRMAYQHRIAALVVQRPIGFVRKIVLSERAAAGERQRRVDMHDLRTRDTDTVGVKRRRLRRIGGDGGGKNDGIARKRSGNNRKQKTPTSGLANRVGRDLSLTTPL
jgi:hypothetical protein